MCSEIAVGDVIRGRFVLEKELGSGGMGTVFKALDRLRQEARDREPYVAVKVLSETFRSQPLSFIALQREAKKAQRLNHPNIVRVYDFDRDGSTIFLLMEYLSGKSLDAVIRSIGSSDPAGLPLRRVLTVVEGVAAALSFAHSNGIVHFDLKPSNVFLTDDGQVKVIDFGIARAIRRPEQREADETVFDPGTLRAMSPSYASPEMIDGMQPDRRDDIFSLACVTYELLTGRHPFDRVPATRARAEKREPVRPARLGRGQWAGLKRALAFDREKRTPTVEQFVSDLRGGHMPSLRPTWIAAGIVAIAIAGGGIGYTVWSRHQQEPGASAPTPVSEAPRRKDSTAVEPEISPQPLPSVVTPIRPPQPQPLPPVVTPIRPAPPPAEIAETPPTPPPDAAAIERELSNVRCSVLEGVVHDTTLVVEGYFGDRQAVAAALEPLAQAAGGLAVSIDEVREIDPLYCRPLEVLQPFAQANRDRNLGLAIGDPATDGRLHEGDDLVLTIKAPERSSYIYVDYFSLDGNVVHMLPSAASRDNRLAASAQTTLGNGGPGGSWTVGEPFGTELVSVISSPKPLFAKVRQEVEPAAGYLADLRKSLARAGTDPGTAGVAAEISFIRTERRS
jgi:serine/threonine protein kinase